MAISNSAVIIMLLLRISYQFVIHVDTCPSNKQSWTKRSRNFHCKSPEVYHCIQNTDHNLIETCMKAYLISSVKDGCPWVHVTEWKAYLGNPFIPCNPMQGGCPEKSHKKYPTNQLYSYPACIKLKNASDFDKKVGLKDKDSRTTKTDSVTERLTSTQEQYSKSVCNSIIGVLVFIIGILVVFICIIKNRSNRRSQEEAGIISNQHQELIDVLQSYNTELELLMSQHGAKERKIENKGEGNFRGEVMQHR